jgi:drug/metabolite transporter (DMT)-like permease
MAPVFNRWAAAPPELIGLFRLAGASLILSIFLKVYLKASPLKLIKAGLCKPHFERASLLCGLVFCLHLWTYSFAAQNTTVAACMILFSANPLFTALGNWFFFKEKITRPILAAFILGFASVVLILKTSLQTSNDLNFYGNLSAVFSAVTYSGYLLLGKKARQKLPNAEFTFLAYLAGALLFLMMALLNKTATFDLPANTLWGILCLILVSTFLGHFIFTYLLKHFDINVLSCAKLTEPVLASFAALLLFSEVPHSWSYVSYALTATALLLLFKQAPKTQ